MSEQQSNFIRTLADRERFRDDYWSRRDPIAEDRLLWRAQSFRHMVHLLPGQTILELGCGRGLFTRQLARVSRGENPIIAVTFGNCQLPIADCRVENSKSGNRKSEIGNRHHEEAIEHLSIDALPGPLAGRQFDFIVAMDLLDRRNSTWLLQKAHELLKPGGQVIFYESNPWNVVLKLHRAASRLLGRRDPRHLHSRPQLYELMSDIGFIRVFAVYNDFVYRPLTTSLAWLFRNLSILLENAPGARTLAGSILVHAQKPPRQVQPPAVSLCEHDALRGAVSVVIPCHNEEMNIGPLIARLNEHFGDYIHEIIPVDDNSRDSTRQVIERLAEQDRRIRPVFRTPPNGVGWAIGDGYRAATGRWVLSMDCDFQHLLPEIRDMFDAAADGYDVVVGSRFSRHSVLLNYPFAKIVANRAFHLLAQVVLLRRFRDLTNNLKLIRRDVLDRLVLKEPGFAVNAETGLQPLLMGCNVREVPISWINRDAAMGSSSFRLLRVGGGYWHVLLNLWRRCVLGGGPYASLPVDYRIRKTWREKDLPVLITKSE